MKEDLVLQLKESIAGLQDVKERIRATYIFCRRHVEFNPEEAFALVEEAYRLSEQEGFLSGKGYYLYFKSFRCWMNSNFEEAEKLSVEALQIFRETGDEFGRAVALQFGSYIYWDNGDYETAFGYVYESLKLSEGDEEMTAWCHHALGVFYSGLKDHDAALRHFETGLHLFGKTGNIYGKARIKSGIGTVMIEQQKWPEAVQCIEETLEIYRANGNHTGTGRALNDLAVIYKLQGQFPEAEETFSRCLSLREEIRHQQGIITTRTELGELYLLAGKPEEAKQILTNALDLAVQMKVKPKIFRIHHLLSECYKQLQDPWKALEHAEKHFRIRNEVAGEQASNKLKHLQTRMATEKSEREAEIHRLKNVELKRAYQEIEEKNKSILDSINYAQRIQQAVLPLESDIKNALPDSFIFFRPRDVVSGDFYWFSNKNGRIYIAAVDCTGHGVPGAFMCMIGNTLLNEIVNEKGIVHTDEILYHLREGVIKSLKQTGAEGENKDGMDIALCAITGRQAEFSGAYNPIWIASKGKIIEINADKQPIGIYTGDPRPFTRHTIALDKDDCLYLFTDGFADQFGGPRGKKMMYRRLQEKISEIVAQPMGTQQQMLEGLFSQWKGNYEQVDDVCLIGIRIH